MTFSKKDSLFPVSPTQQGLVLAIGHASSYTLISPLIQMQIIEPSPSWSHPPHFRGDLAVLNREGLQRTQKSP